MTRVGEVESFKAKNSYCLALSYLGVGNAQIYSFVRDIFEKIGIGTA